jgi:intracellular septation protein
MSEAFQLEPALWRQLSTMWIVAFVVFGAANLFFVYNFSEETWVRFHVFGMIGLMAIFAAIQGVWLYFKLPDSDPQQDP